MPRKATWPRAAACALAGTLFATLALPAPSDSLPAPYTTGARRTRVVLLRWQGTQPTYDTAEATRRVFTADDSVRAFVLKESNGLTDLVPAGVTTETLAGSKHCNTGAWVEEVKTLVPNDYQHLILLGPKCQRSASTATLGAADDLPEVVWVFGPNLKANVLAHEVGHNFGIGHANALKCTEKARAVAMSNKCRSVAYLDNFDVMGRYGYCTYSAANKQRMSWPVDVATVTTSGTYVIRPSDSPATGEPQALRLARTRPDGFGNWYYLEWHTEDFAGCAAREPGASGLIVRVVSDRPEKIDTHLVDVTPRSKKGFDDAYLTPGASFADSASGVTITLVSRTASTATVRVDL